MTAGLPAPTVTAPAERSDSGEAESFVRRPVLALRGLVHSYSGYRFVGVEPGVHVGLPGRHVTVIVSLRDPVEVLAMPDPSRPTMANTTLVGGLHLGPVVIGHDGTQVGIHIDVEPFAVPVLFGCPAPTVTGEVTGLDDLLGSATTRELEERVRAQPTWEDRFAVLDEIFLRSVSDPPWLVPEVGVAWRRLVATRGAVPVSDLAAEVGWSRRHLTERFRREIGLTPKALGRVVRFQAATNLIKADPRRSLAETAAVVGYADQPHLNREFREMTGLSPTAWMAAERLPFVQDDARGDGAPWAA